MRGSSEDKYGKRHVAYGPKHCEIANTQYSRLVHGSIMQELRCECVVTLTANRFRVEVVEVLHHATKLFKVQLPAPIPVCG